jgi:tetratricopeptide (TPR) repeat protein
MLSDDADRALRMLNEGPPSSDPWARATSVYLAAMLYENEGRHAEHRDTLKQALEAYREIGDRWGMSSALTSTGNLLLAEGDLEGSVAAYAEARALMAEITATDDASLTRTRLARAYMRAGDLRRARSELAAARAEVQRVGSRYGRAFVSVAESGLARQEGDRAEARRLIEDALREFELISGGPDQARAMVLGMLAVLDAEEGDLPTARERIRAAAALPGAGRDMPVMGGVALAAAQVALCCGEPERSARLLGAAYALRGTEERGDPEVVQLRRDLGAALGPDGLDRLFAEGAALPRDQALELLTGPADAAGTVPGADPGTPSRPLSD